MIQIFRQGSIRRSSAGKVPRRSGWMLLVFGSLLSAFLAAPTTPAILAQSQNTGTVSGTVTDAQGSIIQGATITLTSIDEGTVSTTKANERGEYLFGAVKAGNYTLLVSAPTFQNYSANSLSINASENVRLDAKLTLGQATDTVTVEAPSATVDTRAAGVATVIDPTLVQSLPVDGNNVVALAALLPGVTNVNAPTTFTNDTGGPTYIVSGSRANQNLFLFDGLMWNNVYYNTGLNFPSRLMLQEVSVQLVNFKAQYGRNVGSVFNVLTKSGTNEIHGSFWEYIQNRALNASDYISGRNPFLVQNQFGATVGGPIMRDKIFFFLGYQDLRSVAEADTFPALPTLAERGLNQDGVTPRPCISPQFAGKTCASFAGDYSATTNLSDVIENPVYATRSQVAEAAQEITSTANTPAGAAQGAAQCLADLENTAVNPTYPNYPEYLPNAEIPSECFNPVTLNLYKKYFPVPAINGVPVLNPTTLLSAVKDPKNDQNGLARVDWNLPGHTIDARFYVTNTNDATSNAVSSTSTSPANYDVDANTGGIYAGNIGDRWVISPSILNELRVGYKRYTYKVVPVDTTTLIGLGSNVTDPGYPTLPRFTANGRFAIGSNSSAYSYNVNASFEVDDNLQWVRGNHSIQVGGQYLDLAYTHRFDQPPFLNSNASYTGVGIADFTFGLIGQETFGNTTNIGAIDHAFYFYVQDDWRATAHLTLNLGLRYELPFPWYQPDGQSTTYIYSYQSYKFPNTPSSLAFQGDPGVPNSIINTKFNNLAPRFGLAYDVAGNGKTVLKAAFGIFYDALNANTTGVGEPYHYTATYSTPPGSFSQPLLTLPAVPINYTGPATAQFGQPYSINFADPNVTEPYTEAVNVGVQQLIGRATLQALYVGKFGRHEIVPYDLNPAIFDCSGTYFQANPITYCTGASTKGASYAARVKYPGFNYGGSGIVDNNSVGTSNYNGFQVIYTQRSSKNLTTVASYTYSRSLDDQSIGTTNASALPEPSNGNTGNVSLNYAPSDFQATHVFNAGWTLKLPDMLVGPLAARLILNDWFFGGVFQAHTGNPFSVTFAGDASWSDEPGQRPPLAPGLTHYQPIKGYRHRSAKVQEWFNVCSFADNTGVSSAGSANSPTNNIPQSSSCTIANVMGQQGFNAPVGPNNPYAPNPTMPIDGVQMPIPPGYTNGVGRNSLYGPAFIESDFTLRRIFNIPYRGMKFELRGEAFNVFNTPNLGQPTSAISSGASTTQTTDHGEIVSTVGKNSNAGTNGRRVQIALELRY